MQLDLIKMPCCITSLQILDLDLLKLEPSLQNHKKEILKNVCLDFKRIKGIINRMGFNNAGLEAAIVQLKKNKKQLIIGGNIGKNTQTPSEGYTADYLECFEALHPLCRLFCI